MKTYNTREVINITGISPYALRNLLRVKGKRGILFTPDYPKAKSGKTQEFSERDIRAIYFYKAYQDLKLYYSNRATDVLVTKNIPLRLDTVRDLFELEECGESKKTSLKKMLNILVKEARNNSPLYEEGLREGFWAGIELRPQALPPSQKGRKHSGY